MPTSIPCDYCKNDIPQPSERCPHCARPGIFWNVISADDIDERTELERRYKLAQADALSRGAEQVLSDFEPVVASSTAVISRSESEVLRLATSTRQLYATYYQQLESGLRLPDGDEWDVLREITDTLLFPKYKQEIRFGALSLDDIGLANYGSCSIALRDEMISHRASVFEENSVLFMKRLGIKASNPDLPKGYRATWADRGKLCVAKLAATIDSSTTANEYSSRVLNQGETSGEDDFVEVHIWGPISARTMLKVRVTTPNASDSSLIIKALKSKLAKYAVPVD